MENIDNEFNLDEELREVRERREKEDREFTNGVHEYLEHLHLVRKAKTGVAIGLTTAIILGGYIGIYKSKKSSPAQPVSPIPEYSMTLTRTYTVERGDTLSEISDNTGIPSSIIEQDNNIDNGNMIYMNQHLLLNYNVSLSDLEYYTETVEVGNKTIDDLVAEYDTNINTLISLNNESIEKNADGTYTILSSTLVVPNFITPSELNELKADQK